MKKIQELKILLVFLFIFAMAALFVPHFLSSNNLYAIIVQMAPIGIISVAMTFVIITAGIDLSVGSLVAMISVLMAGTGNYPIAVMLILALFFGVVAGSVNGFLVSRANLSPFIVTLSTMAAAKGVALWATDAQEHVIQNPAFALIGAGTLLGIPIPVWIFVGLTVLGQVLLKRTVFGKHVCAVGSNPEAARNAGVNVERIRFSVYLMTGVMCALSAIVISSRLNISTPTVGEFYELDAIAAVVIGGTLLFGGRGSVLGTFLGVMIFGIITNSLNLLGASPHLQRIVKGGMIIFAVLLQSDTAIAAAKASISRFLPKNLRFGISTKNRSRQGYVATQK